MRYLLYTLLLLAAAYALFAALRKRAWISAGVAIAFGAAALMPILSPALFFHGMALQLMGSAALLALLFIGTDRPQGRMRSIALAIVAPYLLLLLMKLLQLQGINTLVWLLLIPIALTAYLSIARREWDHYWAQLCYVALAALWILASMP